jgi:predicted  nucleic acid-binding Zn-ribbon protein
LQDDGEVEMLFRALKDAAGSTDLDSPVTFEEFSNGIMDFPFLLQQFKEKYENMCTDPAPSDLEEVLSPSRPTYSNYCADTQLFEASLLREVHDILVSDPKSRAEAPSAPEPVHGRSISVSSGHSDERPEAYFAMISQTLSVISQKLSIERHASTNDLHLTAKSLLSALTRLSAGFKTAISNYGGRLNELEDDLEMTREALDQASHQAEAFEENYCQAAAALNQLEWEFQRHKKEAEKTQAERNKLETKLVAISQSEERTLSEMQGIQEEIAAKEREIERLGREVRRLNSLRTIHEMKKDSFTQERLDQYKNDLKLRNSMPSKVLKVLSPTARGFRPSQRRFLFPELRSDSMNERRAKLAEQGIKRRQEDQEMAWRAKVEEIENRYLALVRELEAKNYDLLLRVKSLEASKKQLEATLEDLNSPRSSVQLEAFSMDADPSNTRMTTDMSNFPKMSRDSHRDKPREMPRQSLKEMTPKEGQKSRYSYCGFWS